MQNDTNDQMYTGTRPDSILYLGLERLGVWTQIMSKYSKIYGVQTHIKLSFPLFSYQKSFRTRTCIYIVHSCSLNSFFILFFLCNCVCMCVSCRNRKNHVDTRTLLAHYSQKWGHFIRTPIYEYLLYLFAYPTRNSDSHHNEITQI